MDLFYHTANTSPGSTHIKLHKPFFVGKHKFYKRKNKTIWHDNFAVCICKPIDSSPHAQFLFFYKKVGTNNFCHAQLIEQKLRRLLWS